MVGFGQTDGRYIAGASGPGAASWFGARARAIRSTRFPSVDAADLAYAGIARQAELIAGGEVGSRELVDLYLERIERLNPRLNAFRVVFDERARMEADQADARRGAGDSERPLLGVPIAVKDEFDVAGEVTTFGHERLWRARRRGRARSCAVLGRRARS